MMLRKVKEGLPGEFVKVGDHVVELGETYEPASEEEATYLCKFAGFEPDEEEF